LNEPTNNVVRTKGVMSKKPRSCPKYFIKNPWKELRKKC
jgi:hypothetical protein